MKISYILLLVILTGVSSPALAGCPFTLNLNYALTYMTIQNNTDGLDVKVSKKSIQSEGQSYKSIELKPKKLIVDHNSSQQGIIDSTWCKKDTSTPIATLYIDIVDEHNSSNDICHVMVTLTGGYIAQSSDLVVYPQTETVSCTVALQEGSEAEFTVTLGTTTSNGN